MWGSTQRLLDACRSSHTQVATVELWDPVRARAIPGPWGTTLPVTDWSTGVDLDNAVRRDLSFTVPGTPDLVPLLDTAPLSIYGTDVRLSLGVRFDDDTVELVPRGVFRVTKATTVDSDAGRAVKVTAADWSWLIRGRASRAVIVYAGTPVEAAVLALCQARYPGVFARIGQTGATVDPLLFTNVDLWAEARRVTLDAAGRDLGFGLDGWLEARDLQTDTTRIVDYTAGQVDGVVVSATRDLDADELYNGVTMTASHTGAQGVVGEAWDEDQRSPTWRRGRFGERALAVDSEVIRDQGQADRAARAMLAQILGTHERIDFSAAPCYAHDVGDVIRVERPDQGIAGLWTIDSLGFSSGALMSVGARRFRP